MKPSVGEDWKLSIELTHMEVMTELGTESSWFCSKWEGGSGNMSVDNSLRSWDEKEGRKGSAGKGGGGQTG